MNHEPFWLDLIAPFKVRFGESVTSYMKLRKIIHHLYSVVYSNSKPMDIDYLVKETGYTKNKVVEIIQWLKEQEIIDFEIEWTPDAL